MSAVDQKLRAWVHSLPVLRLTLRECTALLEYSCSLPTGTTPGKMWKRLEGSFDHAFMRQGGKPRWIVCQYDPKGPDEKQTIGILYFRPIIVVTAVLAQPSVGAAV